MNWSKAVELPAVIIGDGVYHGFEVRQQIGDGLAGQGGGFAYYRAGEIQLTTPLCQRDNGALMGFSHHQVGVPIAQPGACRHDSRALVNIHPARNTSPVVGATVFFSVRLALVAQLPV